MVNDKSKSRLRSLIDTTIITTVSTVTASIIAGVFLLIYQQVNTATHSLSTQQHMLEHLQKDMVKTQELLTEEIAPMKVKLQKLENQKSYTIEDIRKAEEILEGKFKDEARASQQIQQQAPID
jgi:cell division protein FtsX